MVSSLSCVLLFQDELMNMQQSLDLTLIEGYGIVDWRFVKLMNLQCELLIFPANHRMFLKLILPQII